ncbi:hypothetical protein FHR91_002905 [Erythrobacter lutimaris]|nr:hypothetical protein [Alteriqipengyuania lutimaris]
MADSWNDDQVRVLVGWNAQDFGSNMVLRLETVGDLPQSDDDVLVSRMVLNRNQACSWAICFARYRVPCRRRRPGPLGWNAC